MSTIETQALNDQLNFNKTDFDYKIDKTIIELFEEQAKNNPQKIAVIDEIGSITYNELNSRANSLARELKKRGVKKNDIVPILSYRTIDMIVSIYSVLKANAAYLPLSPANPENRILHILEESKVKIVLSSKEHMSKLCNFKGEVLDMSDSLLYMNDIENLNEPYELSDLVYVIYTSGSTGMPKGVMIQNMALANRLMWMQRSFPISCDDVLIQKTNYSFDVSVWEIFWWSLCGASVYLLKSGYESFPMAIIKAIEENSVSVIHFVPSMLNVFLDYVDYSGEAGKLKTLRKVLCSGEALSKELVERFHRSLSSINGTSFTNLYGPTEAAIDVSYFDCDESYINYDSIPIGKPIDNIQLFILNDNEICEIGEVGEIFISGVGLAKGYLNNPKMTDEKFVYTKCFPEKRMYATGDLGRFLPDGNIEYIGRNDYQVKIRGLRIELTEISNHIKKYYAVSDKFVMCEVIAKKISDIDASIVTFIVNGEKNDEQKIMNYLKAELPDYMIPNKMYFLDSMPLNENGKVDRKKLCQYMEK